MEAWWGRLLVCDHTYGARLVTLLQMWPPPLTSLFLKLLGKYHCKSEDDWDHWNWCLCAEKERGCPDCGDCYPPCLGPKGGLHCLLLPVVVPEMWKHPRSYRYKLFSCSWPQALQRETFRFRVLYTLLKSHSFFNMKPRNGENRKEG